MKFGDVRIGQIVYIARNSSYGVVVGLMNDYANLKMLYKGFWNSIMVAFMPLGNFSFTENIKGMEDTETFKKLLRECAREIFSQPLHFVEDGYGVHVVELQVVDIKPLTKEVRNWVLKTNMLQSKEEQQQLANSILTKAKEDEFLDLYQDINTYTQRIQANMKNMRPYKGEKIKKGTILVEDNQRVLLFYTDEEYFAFKFFETDADFVTECLFVISSQYDYMQGRIDESFGTRKFSILDVNVFDCKVNTELVKKYLFNKEIVSRHKERYTR